MAGTIRLRGKSCPKSEGCAAYTAYFPDERAEAGYRKRSSATA